MNLENFNGIVTEFNSPLDIHCELVDKHMFRMVHVVESRKDFLQCLLMHVDILQVKSSRVNAFKLKLQFVVVLEVKFNIDICGLIVVSEESYKTFKSLN